MDLSLSHNILVYVTHCDVDEAKTLARELVSQKLVACANVIPMGTSIYSWQGEVKEELECTMILKTHSSMFHEVEKYVSDNHPYDNPAIISVPIHQMPEKYEQWINSIVK